MQAFGGNVSGRELLESVRDKIRAELDRMDDVTILANSDDELTLHFVQQHDLMTIEAIEDGIGAVPNNGGFTLVIPLVPKPTNSAALRLRSSIWPMDYSDIVMHAHFDEPNSTIRISGKPDAFQQLRDEALGLIGRINATVDDFHRMLLHQIESYLTLRRNNVEERRIATERAMQDLVASGIPIKETGTKATPVILRVRKEIQELRKPASARPVRKGYELTMESVAEILRLIEDTGRGFEAAPDTYAKLGEEELRNIIVGILNTVLGGDIATGETFSKSGKADIRLNTPEGAMLIAECKYWPGKKEYPDVVQQLFRYLNLRHTAGVIIIFSRNKGFTKVVGEAEKAISEDESRRGDVVRIASNYFVSVHEHPDDAEKNVTVHHLFFNLFNATPSQRGRH